MAEPGPGMVEQPASTSRSMGALTGTAIAGFSLAVCSLLLARPVPASGPVPPHIFEYLFSRNEPAAAWLAMGIVLAGLLLTRSARFSERFIVARLAADPRAFIAAATLVLATAAVLVYRAHPLAMDEYAPLFQARVFARGALAAHVPQVLVPRLVPQPYWFIEQGPSGEMISSYWPGLALLLTPFVWLGRPWLLNPLIGAATLVLVWRVARQLWPGTSAAGWAVLFTAASPAFSVNAISFYSMGAHLAASLLFAMLVLENRLLLAGVVGSVALALHNPFPHTLFAIPWIVWLARRPGRVRDLARLAIGYLPGVLVLVVGWIWYRGRVTQPVNVSGGLVTSLGRSLDAFALPGLDLILHRTMNVAELAGWAVPLLMPLAILGAVRCRENHGARLFAVSALLTLAGYSVVAFDQGHGWGFRYFHSAWAAVPLLAAGAMESAQTSPSLRRIGLFAAVCSLVLATPLRFAQVRTFMDAHLAQIPAPSGGREVVFVKTDRGSYTVDLVQNDPFLEHKRWVLISFGDAEDSRFMADFFPTAKRTMMGPFGSLWRID